MIQSKLENYDGTLTTSLEHHIAAVKQVPQDSSVVIVPKESTSENFQPKEVVHFISKRGAELSNNDFVDKEEKVSKGKKTFSEDAFKNDFVVSAVRLSYKATVADDAELKVAEFTSNPPASTENCNFVITQGIDAFSLPVKELMRGNTTREGDFYTLISPIKLRAGVPFKAVIESIGSIANTDAYKLEMKGLELVKTGAMANKFCSL